MDHLKTFVPLVWLQTATIEVRVRAREDCPSSNPHSNRSTHTYPTKHKVWLVYLEALCLK